MIEHLDEALVHRLMDGDLTSDEQAAIDTHLLAGCASCEALLEYWCVSGFDARPNPNQTISLNGSSTDMLLPSVPGYEVYEPLGRGGMGVVYRARDLKLNRDVALKTVRAGEFASSRDLDRLREEARHVAQLDHPNIVPIFEVGEGSGFAFFTMKLVESGTLAQRRSEHREPIAIARIMQKLARAVHYAHQRGLIHCDLKPQNVLIDSNGEPLVSDFGLARHLNRAETITAGVAGTPAYMAPEQARGESGLSTAVDVYALGGILYELLTGHTPYRGTTPLEVIRQVIEREPARPSVLQTSVDPDLEAVCLKCLERQPEARYGGAGEIAEEMERYLRGESVLARPPGLWDWIRQALRKQPEVKIAYHTSSIFLFAAIICLTHLTVFGLIAVGASTPWLWVVLTTELLGCCAVWWMFPGQVFRELSLAEKISSMSALGHIVADTILFCTHAPFRVDAPITDIYRYYPPLTVMTGLAFFVMGSYHWGRFYYLGVWFMLQAIIYRLYPPISPLLHGFSGFALAVWALAIGRCEVIRRRETVDSPWPLHLPGESGRTIAPADYSPRLPGVLTCFI